MKIAVLLTTFNRKDKTLACLSSLQRQKLPVGAVMEVFLTDDASSDGTAEAVKRLFPGVHVFNGNGSLFWAGGMRSTWKQSLAAGADYYLLLNDDTVLTENAVAVLLKCSSITGNQPAICVGSTADHDGNISYGGSKLNSSATPSFYRVYSKTNYLECDLGNANIMLVPHKVVQRIGILSNLYTHGIADYDYTLKAKKAGFAVLVAPGILGNCIDDHGRNWKSGNVRLKERISYLMSPKGLAYKEYLRYIKDHFPLYYPVAFSKLWLKTLFPFLWDVAKK